MSEGVWPHRSTAGTKALRTADGREAPAVQEEEETRGSGANYAKATEATPLLTASLPKGS